ncbi:hypothetical protein ARMSODRAFT_1021375 [Armillaria solidipes]|uniref:Uncharacterized protein n=1 Tax=Armillaria solidipes TaxID=1076256 RepID=A0A2H3BKJ5_9AGAR|nr:hypothetical protein ARMSODRAFT_1021375 [Armillaria solidipes]
MSPDDLSISIVTAIGGACLLSLLVALLVLANIERVERFFRIQRQPVPRPTNPPAWYVIPYVQPRPLVERVDPEQHSQRRTPYLHNPSDEHIPRNATPGPSNVPRTPLPPITLRPRTTGALGALGNESPPRPDTLISEPNPAHAEQIRVYHLRPRPLPAGPIRVVDTPTFPHLCPLPESDSDSDSSDYGGNEPVAEREDDDPFNPYGADYGALVVDLRQIQPSVARISRYILPMCSKILATARMIEYTVSYQFYTILGHMDLDWHCHRAGQVHFRCYNGWQVIYY